MKLYFESLAQWRAWLADNHAQHNGFWMTFYKKHTGKPNVSYEDAVEEALCWGWIDSLIKKIDEDRYERKFTPRKPQSKWSPTNIKRVEKMIAAGRMQPVGMQLIEEAKKLGTWQNPVQAPKEFTMPQELQKALDENPQAREFFETLAPSYKKMYLGWVGHAKREETRQKRAAVAIEKLAKREKLGMV